MNFGKAIVILSKKLVAPAMNTAMLENPITGEGITELPLMGKDQAAAALLDAIEQKRS